MPIYEYRCGHCGQELEAMQKLGEQPLTLCPACKTEGLKKKISAVAFRLKGSGWYETDFKSNKKKNIAGDAEDAPKDKGADRSSSGANPEGDTAKSAESAESAKSEKSEKNGNKGTGSVANTGGESRRSTTKAATPE